MTPGVLLPLPRINTCPLHHIGLVTALDIVANTKENREDTYEPKEQLCVDQEF